MEEEEQKTEIQKQVNIIGLMKNPDQFKKMFQQLKHLAGERLQLHQFESAIQYYLKCIDMMDLGKNLLAHLSPQTRACLFASLAAAYQGAWKIQKCHKYCEKAEEEIQKLISVDDKEQFLKLSKFYVTLKFQHCAILSQLNNHEKALETCKSTLGILQQAINIISDFSRRQEESLNAKCNQQGVMFSRKVYGLAGQILSTLYQQLTEKIQAKQSKSSSFYFWEKNPQKNEEQLKKSFLPQNSSQSRRSILGVNKQNHWVDEFNIGSIMRMGEVKPESIDRPIPMEEYLFKDKLYEIVIQCSLAFFTIATEMRFIDSQKNGQENDTGLTKLDTIKKKYGYEEKSQLFRLSEAYHLRSIEIISANIQAPIPYLSHMIKSYDKHYVFKKKLEEIVAYDESMIQPSSIIHQPNSAAPVNVHKNTEQVEKAYGGQIATINRQTTELQENDDYDNEYLNHVPRKTAKRQQNQDNNNKRIDKAARNTVKILQSLQRDSAKERPKSVGRVRKGRQMKEQNTQKNIHNFTSPQNKTKKKVKGHKQSIKDDKNKKRRIKLTQMQGQGQLHVRTKSSTHIKFVFKKKK